MALKNTRIGTDQRFALSLSNAGAKVNMNDVEALHLCMYSNDQRSNDGSIGYAVNADDATVLDLLWPAKSQSYLGEHSVHGTIRYSGAVASFDVPAVNVVSRTSEADISTETIVLEAPVGTEDLTATITIQGLGPQGPKGDKMTYADLTQEEKKDLYEGASEVMKPLLGTKQNTLTDTDGSYGQRVAELEEGKQNKLTSGKGISIDGDVISATLDMDIIRVVDALPSVGEANIIYLVPAEQPSESDLFEEWVWTDRWERIGSAKIDLSDYATKGYVDTKISSTEENLVHKDGFERITERKQFQKGIGVGLFNTLVANEDRVESGAWLNQEENPAPFIVGEPSEDDHAATKRYVDNHSANVDIYDNLTTEDPDAALSANQGVVLDRKKLDKPTEYLDDSLISPAIARSSEVSEVDGKVSGLSTQVTNLQAKDAEQDGRLTALEQRPIVDKDLTERVDDLENDRKYGHDLANTRIKSISVDEPIKVCDVPMVLIGSGVPSAANVPMNWDKGKMGEWFGIPNFIGQMYVNISASSNALYVAVNDTAVSGWKSA